MKRNLMSVALDAKLSLASDPKAFLQSMHLADSWDPSGDGDEEEGVGSPGLQVPDDELFDLNSSTGSVALSLPDSFEHNLNQNVDYMLKLKDALRFRAPVSHPMAATHQGQGRCRGEGAVEGQLRNELARLRSQLDERLDSLHGLDVSEAAYLELRGRPESQLSVRESAALRMCEAVVPLRRQLDAAHAAAEEYRAALQTSTLTVELQLAETERQRRGGERAQDALLLEKLSLETTTAGLRAHLEREIALRRQGELKAAQFDEAAAELTRLREEVAQLRSAGERSAALVSTLAEGEAAAREAGAEAGRARERLALDKEHLLGETRDLRARLEAYTRELEAAVSRGYALEIRAAEVADRLTEVQRTGRTELEARLERELARLREDSARELESIRASSRELVDRESRVLREARDASDGELRRVQVLLERVTEQAAAREQELRHTLAAREAELSGLRGEVRVKAFELASLAASQEERMCALRQARLEVELLREEGAAHRAALQQLEREAETQSLRLTSELDAARARLAVYGSWEAEMDAAILHAADTPSDPHQQQEKASPLRALLQVAGPHAGFDLDRRTALTIQLAQKLRAAEAALSARADEVEALRAEAARAGRSAQAAAVDQERASRPASYLVQRLRTAEDALERAAAQSEAQQRELESAARRLALAEGEARDMQERLVAVLRQREELAGLERALVELREKEEQVQEQQEQAAMGDIDDDDDADEGEDATAAQGETGTGTGVQQQSQQPLSIVPSNAAPIAANAIPDGSALSRLSAAVEGLHLPPDVLRRLTSQQQQARKQQSEEGGGGETTAKKWHKRIVF